MPLLLVLLFIVVPLAELYVIVQVGQAIGIGPTILVLFIDSVVGAVLLRSQGAAAWRRFRATLAAGSMPAREILEGALIIVGGALLLTPGFLTDIVGLLLLIPPTRAGAVRLLTRILTAHPAVGMATFAVRTGQGMRRRRSYDVEGSATESPERGRPADRDRPAALGAPDEGAPPGRSEDAPAPGSSDGPQPPER